MKPSTVSDTDFSPEFVDKAAVLVVKTAICILQAAVVGSIPRRLHQHLPGMHSPTAITAPVMQWRRHQYRSAGADREHVRQSGPASANRAALDIASDHLSRAGHTVVPVERLAEVPAFRPQCVDDAGSVVESFRETLESCDGVLLAVPEYAGGLAGVVKNALDWLVGSASLYHRPFVVLSAGTTGGGSPSSKRSARSVGRARSSSTTSASPRRAPRWTSTAGSSTATRSPASNAGPVNSSRRSVPHPPSGSPWSRTSSLPTESTPLDSETFRRHE